MTMRDTTTTMCFDSPGFDEQLPPLRFRSPGVFRHTPRLQDSVSGTHSLSQLPDFQQLQTAAPAQFRLPRVQNLDNGLSPTHSPNPSVARVAVHNPGGARSRPVWKLQPSDPGFQVSPFPSHSAELGRFEHDQEMMRRLYTQAPGQAKASSMGAGRRQGEKGGSHVSPSPSRVIKPGCTGSSASVGSAARTDAEEIEAQPAPHRISLSILTSLPPLSVKAQMTAGQHLAAQGSRHSQSSSCVSAVAGEDVPLLLRPATPVMVGGTASLACLQALAWVAAATQTDSSGQPGSQNTECTTPASTASASQQPEVSLLGAMLSQGTGEPGALHQVEASLLPLPGALVPVKEGAGLQHLEKYKDRQLLFDRLALQDKVIAQLTRQVAVLHEQAIAITQQKLVTEQAYLHLEAALDEALASHDQSNGAPQHAPSFEEEGCLKVLSPAERVLNLLDKMMHGVQVTMQEVVAVRKAVLAGGFNLLAPTDLDQQASGMQGKGGTLSVDHYKTVQGFGGWEGLTPRDSLAGRLQATTHAGEEDPMATSVSLYSPAPGQQRGPALRRRSALHLIQAQAMAMLSGQGSDDGAAEELEPGKLLPSPSPKHLMFLSQRRTSTESLHSLAASDLSQLSRGDLLAPLLRPHPPSSPRQSFMARVSQSYSGTGAPAGPNQAPRAAAAAGAQSEASGQGSVLGRAAGGQLGGPAWRRSIGGIAPAVEPSSCLRDSTKHRARARSVCRASVTILTTAPEHVSVLLKQPSDMVRGTSLGHTGLNMALSRAEEGWSFDAFELSEVSGGRPLSTLAFALLRRMHLIQHFQLREGHLARFLCAIEDGYPNNPYHCRTHAADVLRTVHCMMTRGRVGSMLGGDQRVDLLAVYISALIHDYEHKGVNNQFLISTGDELALRYNDRSPMENHHIAAAFQLMAQEETNIFASTSSQVRDVVRRYAIELVLATDMKQVGGVTGGPALTQCRTPLDANALHSLALSGPKTPVGLTERACAALSGPPQHFAFNSMFNNKTPALLACINSSLEGATPPSLSRAPSKVQPGDTPGPGPLPPPGPGKPLVEQSSPQSPGAALPATKSGAVAGPVQGILDDDLRLITLQMVLKVSDLGHLAHARDVHRRWVQLLEEELFRQGDQELAAGLPVSPLMDRTKAGVTRSQAGFYSLVCLPQLMAFTTVFPGCSPMLDQARDNLVMWLEEGEAKQQGEASPAGALSHSPSGHRRPTPSLLGTSNPGHKGGQLQDAHGMAGAAQGAVAPQQIGEGRPQGDGAPGAEQAAVTLDGTAAAGGTAGPPAAVPAAAAAVAAAAATAVHAASGRAPGANGTAGVE
ncbi:hypothetical protein QJQ45_021631 [Haematococcus lacustris]|nr:hypothetical protein QJQ45_021631 [Haematococcus lacustris]